MTDPGRRESTLAWVLKTAGLITVGAVVVVVLTYWLVDLMIGGFLNLTGLGGGFSAGGVILWMVGLVSLIPRPQWMMTGSHQAQQVGQESTWEQRRKDALAAATAEKPFLAVAFLAGLVLFLLGILLRCLAM